MSARRMSPTEEDRDRVLSLFVRTRARTEELVAPLSAEDQQLQSMPDASPVKWHRAHTTWFFEAFVLEPAGVPSFDPRYGFLFNSYYESVGPRHARPKRGLLSRPSASEVGDYRRAVDERVVRWLASADERTLARALPVVELGVAHEEQHQELILTDVHHALSESPLAPAYLGALSADEGERAGPAPARFVAFEGGLHEVGAADDARFAFDNERPRHKVWVEPFQLADRLVTIEEYLGFVADGGYEDASLWLSEGFDAVRAQGLRAPLYAAIEGRSFVAFTLRGKVAPAPDTPVTHLSYYEADAIARYLGGRLPTEVEWEVAAARAPVSGNFLDDGRLRASAAPRDARGVGQLFGDAWEWTSSGYDPYPGFTPAAGAIGEYNGKFMVGQKVLRGGSCLTPRRHVRATYRNFWHPATRFQMSGLRVARDVRA